MIFALVGEEVFLLQRAMEGLLQERLPSSARDFNFDSLQGEEVEARRLMGIAGTLPTLSTRRLVLIRDADRIKKGEMERLELFLSDLPETTDLVLVAEKADLRTAFWQKVKKLADFREFHPLDPREVPRWIMEEVPKEGYAIDTEAARWLVTAVGNDLSLISSTLQKLYLFKKGEKRITLSDLESCVVPFSWRSVFDLTEAVGRRDLSRALGLFRKMDDSGESPIGLLALLARHFRILSRVKEGETGGVPFLREYQRQAAEFPWEDLSRCRERIFRTDWALKSSPLPAPILFERLLMELCH